MTITIFIGSLVGGGAERVACNLANHLCQHGYNINMLNVSEVEKAYPLDNRVKVHYLLKVNERKNIIYNTILRFCRYVKFVFFQQTDVFVVFLPFTINLTLSTKFLTNAKIIAAERANPDDYPLSVQSKLKKNAKKADGWVFQTINQKKWYEPYIAGVASKVIPNAINTDFIRPIYKGGRRKEIVTSGRLTEQKNHKLLIHAFSRITNQFPDYRLVIYGEGPLKNELQNLINSLGLSEKIYMPGYTTDIGNKIKDASLFVLSSDFEGMPNALMEAMALGVPCISTDCSGGGARFLIENGKNGILIPPKDENSMVDAMISVLSNSKLASSFGIEGHKICESLAPDLIYGEWESYIKYIVSKAG